MGSQELRSELTREISTNKLPLDYTLKCVSFNWEYIVNDILIYKLIYVRVLRGHFIASLSSWSEIGTNQEMDRQMKITISICYSQ